MTTVFASGCFDQLHCGHVAFLKAARTYGDRLVVAIGSDDTITKLKKRSPLTTEAERVFMVESLGCVDIAYISPGAGYLDFELVLRSEHPGVFVVNWDGDRPEKRALCESLGWRYEVINIKSPDLGLPMRSTTDIRRQCIPYRIDLAGGWLDQPVVSAFGGGPVIVASIEPTVDFLERGGMATSTRARAIELFGDRLPSTDPRRLAPALYAVDDVRSGSQDAYGIVFPGVNRLGYGPREPLPHSVELLPDAEGRYAWLEHVLSLLPLWPRPEAYEPMRCSAIAREGNFRLYTAAENVWAALRTTDTFRLGQGLTATLSAQRSMFPAMVDARIQTVIHSLPPEVLGCKLTGAGGGGYLLVASETPIPNGIKIKIRRPTT
jgi:cytidyltransferase-like protein